MDVPRSKWSKMASSMVIPASKDTLFMRGFSSRLHTDEIREAGRNTVEFFKDDGNGQLYIALKFESKDVAKEVLNRFDNTDILGDRVTMSWYKDLRKLRTDSYRRQGGNRHWTPEDRHYDYHDRGMYQRRMYNTRGRWPPPSAPGRSRHYTRSSSRSRSRSFSQSPSARSYSRSHSSSASYDSRDKKKKRHSISDSGKRHRLSEKRKIAKNQKSPSVDRDSSASESSVQHGKRGAAKKGEDEGSVERKSARAKERNVEAEDDVVDTTADGRSDNNDYSVEPSSPPSGAKAIRNIRSAVLSIDRTKNHPVTKQAEPEAIPSIASPDILESGKKQEPLVAVPVNAKEAAKLKKLKDDRRMYEEQISDEEDSAKEKTPLANKKNRGEHGDDEFFAFEKPRGGSRLAKSNATGQASGISDLYEPEDTRDVRVPKRRKVASEDILEYERPTELDYEEELDSGRHEVNDFKRKRIDPVSIQDARQPRGPHDGIAVSAKRRPFYNENNSSINRGALGLSQEKMALIRDKKEEIEKAYRQDCETFATVTKLLISKDPDLEERIQNSLRENLKEIGQRCIQELREFVDRLKTEDDI